MTISHASARPAILVIDPEVTERSRLVSLLRDLNCDVSLSTKLHRVPEDHPGARFDIVVLDVDSFDAATIRAAAEQCELVRSTPDLQLVALTRFPTRALNELLRLVGCAGSTPVSKMESVLRSAIAGVRQADYA